MSHLGNDFRGNAHDLPLEEFDRIPSATGRYQFGEPHRDLLRSLRKPIIEQERWIVQR
jgi:hypothetical protein